MKKGLEILGISIVDADIKNSIFLKAEQTFTGKKRGRKPKCADGMDDPDSLTGWYLRMLTSIRRQLLSVCMLIVADAYFSKESFVTGVQRLGFDLVSRFRDDVRLRDLQNTFPAGVRVLRCQAVHWSHALPGQKQQCTVVCLQRIPHFCQHCQGFCTSAGDGPFGGFNQNAAAQRCNGGAIYFHVRKTCGHEI